MPVFQFVQRGAQWVARVVTRGVDLLAENQSARRVAFVIGAVLVVLFLYWRATAYVKQQYARGVEAGTEACTAAWEQRLAQATAKTRELEQQLANAAATANAAVARDRERIRAQYNQQLAQMQTALEKMKAADANPQCLIPQEALDARNRIRRLAP